MTSHISLLDHLLQTDLACFLQQSFETLNPALDYLDNWHIRAMCHEATKVVNGETRQLLVTLPPRHLKSQLFSMALPAWALMHNPSQRIVCVSYGADLAEEFADGTLQIMRSSWYRRIAPQVKLDPKRSKKEQFWTTAQGFRLASSVGGALTGKGGNLRIIDDIIKAEDAVSDVKRAASIEYYRRTLATRVQDPKTSATIVVGQRLHEEDLPGHLITEGGWRHLNLPAEAYLRQEIEVAPNTIYIREPGDILHPRWMGRRELDDFKVKLGEAQYEAQMNQRPVPPGGLMVQLKWFPRFDLGTWERDAGPYGRIGKRRIESIYQSWDLALGGDGKGDWSVGITWAICGDDHYILNIDRTRIKMEELYRRIITLRRAYGARAIVFEDDMIAKMVRTQIRPLLDEDDIYATAMVKLHSKSKPERLALFIPELEQGRVLLPAQAEFLSPFETELVSFPNGRHDDQVDAMTTMLTMLRRGSEHGAFNGLTRYDD